MEDECVRSNSRAKAKKGCGRLVLKRKKLVQYTYCVVKVEGNQRSFGRGLNELRGLFLEMHDG